MSTVTDQRTEPDQRRMRPEAQSVLLDELLPDQERAFGVLVDLIEAAIKDLPDDREWKNDLRLEHDAEDSQASRVLLLSGGRGSGKTTVSNSLQHAISVPSRELHELAASTDDDALRNRRNEIAGAVDRIQPRVIPLERLSMADLPRDTNLLAALLARIEQLLFPRLTAEDMHSMGSDQRHHDAVLELMRLQTDVAIAWNGNLRERRGSLDPDNYAMEELRVERVRLQLRDRFERVLRRTARDSLGHDVAALFLLIVDDADVNPARLLDLVDRLRMVGVPELLVLIVGDVQPIETAFRLHYADRFRDPDSRLTPDDIGMRRGEMSSLTNSIGRSALRKHLPYHQRVVLQPLPVCHALAIKPLKRSVRRLEDLLRAVPVGYPDALFPEAAGLSPSGDAERSTTLREFIIPDAPTRGAGTAVARRAADATTDGGDAATGAHEPATAESMAVAGTATEPSAAPARHCEDEHWYVGTSLLSDSPRVAIDLWHALRDACDAQPGQRMAPLSVGGGCGRPVGQPRYWLDPRLHNFFRQLAAERVDANWHLWKDHAIVDARVREQVAREGDLSALQLLAEHDHPDRWHRTTSRPSSNEICWTHHSGLDYTVCGNAATSAEVGPLVLAQDLGALESDVVAERAITQRADWQLRWVVSRRADRTTSSPTRSDTAADQARSTESHPHDPAQTERARKEQARTDYPAWEVPRYRTTRQIEEFGLKWNEFLASWEHVHERGRTAEDLAEAWVILHTETLVGCRHDRGSPYLGASSAPRIDSDRLTTAKRRLRRLVTLVDGDDEWLASIARHWLAAVREVLETAEVVEAAPAAVDLATWLVVDTADGTHRDGDPAEVQRLRGTLAEIPRNP